jgi:peptide/nickel transport system permease protein
MATSPHQVIIPGLTIVIAALSINLFGDGLRDALDPRLKP